MSAIDYQAIRDAIKATLEGEPSLSGVNVLVEPEPDWDVAAELAPHILIFLSHRTSTPGQAISAGLTHDYYAIFDIWVVHFSLISRAEAVRLRDGVLGNAELALLKNRTLSGTVRSSLLEGGEMFDAREENAYAATAQIRLRCGIRAKA